MRRLLFRGICRFIKPLIPKSSFRGSYLHFLTEVLSFLLVKPLIFDKKFLFLLRSALLSLPSFDRESLHSYPCSFLIMKFDWDFPVSIVPEWKAWNVNPRNEWSFLQVFRFPVCFRT